MSEKAKQAIALWLMPAMCAAMLVLMSIIGWFGAKWADDIKANQDRFADRQQEMQTSVAVMARALDANAAEAEQQSRVQTDIARDVNNLDKRVSKLEDAAVMLHWPGRHRATTGSQ